MDASSRRLVAKARTGDRRALEELLARHLPGLRAFVRLNAGPRLRAREAQSDLVQTVCREILERLDEFEYRDEPSFRAWLFQLARRKIVDRARYWRSQRRAAEREVALRESSSDEVRGTASALLSCYATFCTPSRLAMVHEEQERIEEAFARLPPDQRRVITLARIVGLPHREIAAQMHRNENAVRQLLFRALANLAVRLDRTAPSRPRAWHVSDLRGK